jgi:hypothetical protein
LRKRQSEGMIVPAEGGWDDASGRDTSWSTGLRPADATYSNASPMPLAPHRTRTKHTAVAFFHSRGMWERAARNVVPIDFEGIASRGGIKHFNTPAGVTLGGVRFVGSGLESRTRKLAVVSAIRHPHVSAWGPGDKLQSGGTELLVTLPPGTLVAGWDVMVTVQAFLPCVSHFSVVINGDYTFADLCAHPPPKRSFVGFVAQRPIESIALVCQHTFPLVGNFSIGT